MKSRSATIKLKLLSRSFKFFYLFLDSLEKKFCFVLRLSVLGIDFGSPRVKYVVLKLCLFSDIYQPDECIILHNA